MKYIFCTALMFLLTLQAWAQSEDKASGMEYPDRHGGTVYLPLGDASFVDGVVKPPWQQSPQRGACPG